MSRFQFARRETKLGTISKVGSWTLSLEVTRCSTHQRARAAAYTVAAQLCAALEEAGFDIRVEELIVGSIVVCVEVGSDDDFELAAGAIERAAEHARAR